MVGRTDGPMDGHNLLQRCDGASKNIAISGSWAFKEKAMISTDDKSLTVVEEAYLKSTYERYALLLNQQSSNTNHSLNFENQCEEFATSLDSTFWIKPDDEFLSPVLLSIRCKVDVKSTGKFEL